MDAHGQAADSFGRDAWERHWREASAPVPPSPYLARETSDLEPGTALDAGCGAGAETVWLATQGWRVIGVDIAPTALARAAALAERPTLRGAATWVEADLTTWEPDEPLDLVLSSYTPAAIPQLELYRRLAGWVAPGGSLLIVGHLHGRPAGGHGHRHDEQAQEHGRGDRPPPEATVSLASVTALFDAGAWVVETAEEHVRTAAEAGAQPVRANDIVVRTRRRPESA